MVLTLVIVKVCCNKQLCRVDKGIVGVEDFISHFKERPHWVKVTTQSLVVCSAYKSPCPLRLDLIHLMPNNSPLKDPNCWTCLACVEVSLRNNICGEFLGIEKNKIGKRKGLLIMFSEITKRYI